MNKMVVNHLEKLFVTNDAGTIIRELEVEHPAAKMMILGSQMMEQEVTHYLVEPELPTSFLHSSTFVFRRSVTGLTSSSCFAGPC